ncbi:HAMP domain-containing histidine kinase [Fulvivirga sp. RKSG066]|uniref:sensor histidine kinase n=1 Tax=Fulvivirga aurantia TaxID=2529383 RepID=UPI0012BC9371|nr:HAMP domain-containing sensor histidine kinase [Fulvivirga aurantia]MTI21145.1 HAMP domain-containing histidine kinase [Fulvivirga aurantia]
MMEATHSETQYAVNELSEINEVLDRFVYSCSHDLKGPLVSIKGLLRLAEMSTQKEATDECLTLINESVARMDKFLKSLESYVGNARGPVLRNDVDFNTIIQGILARNRSKIKENKVKVNLRVRQPKIFKSDTVRIDLILTHIIENAIFFQDTDKAERFVDIEVIVNQEQVKIEVCDNGEGITKENMDKIFRMFFRASEASKGSGMGLYLTQETIKKLSGTINVVSSKGVGSNFVVTIPNLD